MSNDKKFSDLFDSSHFSSFSESLKSALQNKLKELVDYTPKIGIMGKSGAGKSSLINAIVGKKVCETSSAGGCTRELEEIKVPMGNREIIFVDLPGIAENQARHEEYTKLYTEAIKDLDLILWAIKVDDRATVNDEEFYQWLITEGKGNYKESRVLFVMTQCDKADPSREFDHNSFKLSLKQRETVNANIERLVTSFGRDAIDIIPIACDYYEDESKFKKYNFEILISKIIKAIPNEAKSSFYASIDKEHQTESTKAEAKEGFASSINAFLDELIDISPLKLIGGPIKKAKKYIIDWCSEKWNSFFG